MKKIIYLFSLIGIFSITQSIAQELPKDGAVITMEETSINIVPGKEHESIIELVKSKRYRNAEFGGLVATTPEGLKIDFIPTENESTYKMIVMATLDAELKSYTIIIRGQGKNSHKVKGIAVALNLAGEQIVTAH